MNKLSTKFNGKTICVFANIEKINVHLANIDTMTNRIYTTYQGYELLASNGFKRNHNILSMEDEISEDSDNAFCRKPETNFRKFNACVIFQHSELSSVISMCNRAVEF